MDLAYISAYLASDSKVVIQEEPLRILVLAEGVAAGGNLLNTMRSTIGECSLAASSAGTCVYAVSWRCAGGNRAVPGWEQAKKHDVPNNECIGLRPGLQRCAAGGKLGRVERSPPGTPSSFGKPCPWQWVIEERRECRLMLEWMRDDPHPILQRYGPTSRAQEVSQLLARLGAAS